MSHNDRASTDISLELGGLESLWLPAGSLDQEHIASEDNKCLMVRHLEKTSPGRCPAQAL